MINTRNMKVAAFSGAVLTVTMYDTAEVKNMPIEPGVHDMSAFQPLFDIGEVEFNGELVVLNNNRGRIGHQVPDGHKSTAAPQEFHGNSNDQQERRLKNITAVMIKRAAEDQEIKFQRRMDKALRLRDEKRVQQEEATEALLVAEAEAERLAADTSDVEET